MSVNGQNGDGVGGEAARPAAAAAPRRRTPWPLVVVAILFVVVPFLTWYTTWFGRGLSDEKIGEYLREGKPRHAQHALSQVAERLAKGDAGARRWFPQVLALAESPLPDVRMTAAWVMGEEHRSEEFRAGLLKLLSDPEPIVRRNAALALVRFGDARCRPELLSMLRPYAVKAPADGEALTALSQGTPVKRDALLVRYTRAGAEGGEVRSPLPGRVGEARVKAGDGFRAGDDLFLLAPDAEQAQDALVGLLYFGTAEDLPEIERYARGVEGMPEGVKRQAALTADAVRRRSAGQSQP
ncbi:MAG TPA: HEAT repeat domain-containing protein [Pyrinomonadaceae bacterium]|nr:HEAT repeat domain-containing protein [Pyrinomonadaceae bacterium]